MLCIDALGHLSDHRRIFAAWACVLKGGGQLLFTANVITGPLSNVEIAVRTRNGYALLHLSGGHERLLEEAGFELLRREDPSVVQAEIARRLCVARATYADALRAAQGDTVIEEENRFLAVVEQLARERRLSHIVFLARKPVGVYPAGSARGRQEDWVHHPPCPGARVEVTAGNREGYRRCWRISRIGTHISRHGLRTVDGHMETWDGRRIVWAVPSTLDG